MADYSDILNADFSKVENMQVVVDKAIESLILRGGRERNEFNIKVREHINRALAAVRKNAVREASGRIRGADIGAAATAVHRRTYRDSLGGNINILGSRGRLSTRKRPYTPSGRRDVLARTRTLNEYYGPDRGFILRILESGRDQYMAESGTGARGRGSRQTWGRRGAIAKRPFFGNIYKYMDAEAKRMGTDVVTLCAEILNQQ